MIRRIYELIGAGLPGLAAFAGALALAGCANLPGVQAEDSAATVPAAAPAAGTVAATATARPAAAAAKASSATPPVNTITLPDRGKVSLSEYRAQMREQLMKTENTTADVADCAAHASWVVPRSPIYDALKIPTGALGSGQATVEPWSGRFSQGKQAVPVSSVVTFSASAHRRSGDNPWQPVRVRCGYDDGMMLAYELLDAGGTPIAEPAAAPAVSSGGSTCTTTKRKGKTVKHCTAPARSSGTKSSGTAKSGKTKSTSTHTSSTKSSPAKSSTKSTSTKKKTTQ